MIDVFTKHLQSTLGVTSIVVTHDMDSCFTVTDRLAFLYNKRIAWVGPPEEVMTTEVLSELYGSHVEVIKANGRLIVVGLPDATTHHHEDAHAVAGEMG